MTVNRYLIYDRCEERGIDLQPDSLRNNVQKALSDANVTVSILFPNESLEVRTQKLNDNPASHSPVSQPPQETSPDSTKPSSDHISPDLSR